ncbi:MAG: hypothetical protein WDM90_13480 [Ferruginibacter sp.]
MVDKLPVLGICYGAQLTAKLYGGRVDKSEKKRIWPCYFYQGKRRYFFRNVSDTSQVWMSHSDTIKELPEGFELLGDNGEYSGCSF